MLRVSGANKFYYIRNFTDMRCKYGRVLSVIRHQLGREPEAEEVFIVMSKDRRLVRLFTYDRISYGLYEKRFVAGYAFMRVEREADGTPVYRIEWRDLVQLLESPVRKKRKTDNENLRAQNKELLEQMSRLREDLAEQSAEQSRQLEELLSEFRHLRRRESEYLRRIAKLESQLSRARNERYGDRRQRVRKGGDEEDGPGPVGSGQDRTEENDYLSMLDLVATE